MAIFNSYVWHNQRVPLARFFSSSPHDNGLRHPDDTSAISIHPGLNKWTEYFILFITNIYEWYEMNHLNITQFRINDFTLLSHTHMILNKTSISYYLLLALLQAIPNYHGPGIQLLALRYEQLEQELERFYEQKPSCKGRGWGLPFWVGGFPPVSVVKSEVPVWLNHRGYPLVI